jgi:hypothetical protein
MENVTYPSIGGAPYTVPDAGEEGWPELTDLLVALASTAQSTGPQKVASRIATTSPVTVGSASDCVVSVKLTVPGPATVSLPVGVTGQYFAIGDGSGLAGTNNITIVPNGTDKIAGQTSYLLNQDNAAVVLCFVGAGNWVVTSKSAGGSSGGAISRTALSAGTPGYVVVNDVSGLMSEEQYLKNTRGGLGVNASAFNGFVKATAGIFSAGAIAASDLPTGIDPLKLGSGTVDATELGYLDGVTSNVQTQISSKLTGNIAITAGTFAKITFDVKGLVTGGQNLAATDLPTGIDALKIGAGIVDNTEFGYLDGVTGNIQTQITNRAIGVASAVDTEVAIFSGTGGKQLARATGTGIAYLTAGTLTTKTFDQILPTQTGNATKVLTTNGTTASWQAGSGAGGLSPVEASANVTTAVNNTMYSCSSTGGFTITLPPVPGLGGVIGVMDAAENCSASNFIRVTPATGQSIDSYAANDSLLLDYSKANVVLYAAPGATSWKVQYQATSMISPGLQVGYTGSTAISAGNIGERISGTLLAPTYSASGTSYNLASLALTAGVWMVYGKGHTSAAGTTQTIFECSISSTSATHNAKSLTRDITNSVTADRYIAPSPISLVTTGTTVYLVGSTNYTGTAPSNSSSATELYAIRIA